MLPYKYAAADPAFADLCSQYQISENQFEGYLKYIQAGWPKKDDDTIINFHLSAPMDAVNYHWMKLSATSKHALILERIIGCTDMERNKYSAIALPDHCFYVLLKNSRIIGYSHVWKSKRGNLCLDSIEYLPNEISDDLLKKMITTWAKEIVQRDGTIKYITTGWNNLFTEETVPESMQQDDQYDIERQQYYIAQTPRNTWTPSLKTTLRHYSPIFRRCLEYLTAYITDPEHFIAQLQTHLIHNPSFATELTFASLNSFLNQNPSPSSDHFFVPVHFEALALLDSGERKTRLDKIAKSWLVWTETNRNGLLNLLTRVPPGDERLRIATLTDYKGSTILHEITSHDDVTNISSLWKLLGNLGSYVLSFYLVQTKMPPPSPLFVRALNLLSWEQRFLALKAKDQHGKSVFITAIINCLNMMAENMREEQFFALITERNHIGETLVHQLIREEPYINAILKHLSKPHRLDVARMKNKYQETVFHQLARSYPIDHFPSFQALLASLDEEQLFELATDLDAYGNPLLHQFRRHPHYLTAILTPLSRAHLLTVIQQKNKDGETVLHSMIKENLHSSCSAILATLEPEQILETIMAIDDSGRNLLYFHSAWTIILDHLKEKRLEAVMKKDLNDESLWSIAQKNSAQFNELLKKLLGYELNNVANNPAVTRVLDELFCCKSPHLQHTVFNHEECLSPDLIAKKQHISKAKNPNELQQRLQELKKLIITASIENSRLPPERVMALT